MNYLLVTWIWLLSYLKIQIWLYMDIIYAYRYNTQIYAYIYKQVCSSLLYLYTCLNEYVISIGRYRIQYILKRWFLKMWRNSKIHHCDHRLRLRYRVNPRVSKWNLWRRIFKLTTQLHLLYVIVSALQLCLHSQLCKGTLCKTSITFSIFTSSS